MSTPDADGVHGTVCTEDQYQNSTNVNPNGLYPTTTCLTHGQTIGLTLVAEASFLSLVAVVFVFVLIGRNVLRYKQALPHGSWTLLQGPSDVYMLALFLFDILQALGGILNVRWANNGIVTIGSYCTAQGIIQQIGELGVALITIILTVHTFVVALWKVGFRARNIAFGVVAVATVFVGLWVGIGNGTHNHYETPTPYWCWIGPGYGKERLAGEYIWLWIALFASVIMNFSLYFWMKGRLSVNLQRMLFYPLAFAVIVLPLTITRWSSFDHKHVSSAATFFSVFVFNLSGVVNVLLFLIVRPELLLFTPPEDFIEPQVVDISPPTNGSAVFNDPARINHSPQPTGTGIVDDGEWEPPLDGNDIALARIESTRPDV